MRPSEVIVLYVEVLFACSTLIIKINEIENSLTEIALEKLKKLDFVETYFTKDVERAGIIAFNVKNVH
ncbi:MAG: hypothetical protein ACFNOO_06705, partial [Segatella oulorum]